MEVDGPFHYAINTLTPFGEDLARKKLLAARDWTVISVPFFTWQEADDDAARKELLSQVENSKGVAKFKSVST